MGNGFCSGLSMDTEKSSHSELAGMFCGSERSTAVVMPDIESAVLVTVEVKEDRINDFLKAMEDDVRKSRDESLDPGCVRFDLLRDRESSNKFVFYEAYKTEQAKLFHKTTSHYNSWAEFKKNGGVESQEVVEVETASIPGRWAFQRSSKSAAAAVQPAAGALVDVEIRPERLDDFFKVLEADANNSRLEPGCLRFDLLRDKNKTNRFIFYEAFLDDEAAAFHKTTEHYKAWGEFKTSGGHVSQTAVKVATATIPGGWAFQA